MVEIGMYDLVQACECHDKLCFVNIQQKKYTEAFFHMYSYIEKASASPGLVYPFEGRFLDDIRDFVNFDQSPQVAYQLSLIIRLFQG
jgi:hypothetical protein